MLSIASDSEEPGLFFLYVTTTISIKSLTLEGTHSYYVSSGSEFLLAVTTWSFCDFSSVCRIPKYTIICRSGQNQLGKQLNELELI